MKKNRAKRKLFNLTKVGQQHIERFWHELPSFASNADSLSCYWLLKHTVYSLAMIHKISGAANGWLFLVSPRSRKHSPMPGAANVTSKLPNKTRIAPYTRSGRSSSVRKAVSRSKFAEKIYSKEAEHFFFLSGYTKILLSQVVWISIYVMTDWCITYQVTPKHFFMTQYIKRYIHKRTSNYWKQVICSTHAAGMQKRLRFRTLTRSGKLSFHFRYYRS